MAGSCRVSRTPLTANTDWQDTDETKRGNNKISNVVSLRINYCAEVGIFVNKQKKRQQIEGDKVTGIPRTTTGNDLRSRI